MNETNNQERNELVVRILAIVGFVLLVIVLAWFAIQVVRFVPVAFSSLASIFEANQRDLHDRTTGDENVVVVNEGKTPDEASGDEQEQVVEETPEEVPKTDVTNTSPVATSTSTSTPNTTTTTTTTKPAPIQYKTVVTYKTPVSDPNGYTDLQVAFVAVGSINSSGRFVASDYVSEDEQNALQFTVKNIGTKTSSEWSFEAELPNGGVMDSKVQKPLSPSETSTLTIVFEMDDANRDRYAEVKVTGGNDTTSANNSFRTKVRVK